MENFFYSHGVKSNIIKSNEDKDRATIITTIGDKSKPGIILSGHLDTYGVTSQIHNWKTDPFKLEIKNNNLIGRGVVDMKGSISAALSNIEELKKLNFPIHFVLTHDEEGRFRAINQLLENNFYNLFNKEQIACIVLEPTSSIPVIGHKGYERHIVKIKVLDDNIKNGNAIKLCDEIKRYIRFTYNKTLWSINDQFDDLSNLNLRPINSEFPTRNQNSFEFQLRYLPVDGKKAQQFLHKVCIELNKMFFYAKKNGVNISIQNIQKINVLPFQAEENTVFLKKINKNLNIQKPKTMSFGTEAGYFQKFGIKNTIILGAGDYTKAHRSNESLSIQDFEEYTKLLLKLIQSSNSAVNFFSKNLLHKQEKTK